VSKGRMGGGSKESRNYKGGLLDLAGEEKVLGARNKVSMATVSSQNKLYKEIQYARRRNRGEAEENVL